MSDVLNAPPQPMMKPDANAQGSPIWYELMTPDPAAATAFYRATLGWEIHTQGGAMPNGAEYREISRAEGGLAGGVLTLTPGMTAGGARPGWLPYFYVADVDSDVAKAQGLGASVHMAPSTIDGVGRIAMLTDPQGAAFYVMKPTPPAGDPNAQSDVFHPMKAGHCRWNEVMTPDAAATLGFYLALFGWTKGMTMPMGEAGDYQLVEAGGVGIGAVCPVQGTPSLWLPYFGVAEIAAAKAAVEANGGTITQDLQEIPGGEFSLTCTDPSGAPLGFVGPKGA